MEKIMSRIFFHKESVSLYCFNLVTGNWYKRERFDEPIQLINIYTGSRSIITLDEYNQVLETEAKTHYEYWHTKSKEEIDNDIAKFESNIKIDLIQDALDDIYTFKCLDPDTEADLIKRAIDIDAYDSIYLGPDATNQWFYDMLFEWNDDVYKALMKAYDEYVKDNSSNACLLYSDIYPKIV